MAQRKKPSLNSRKKQASIQDFLKKAGPGGVHQIIYDSVPAMIWFKDKENRILRANEAAASSLGKTVKEMENKSAYELYPQDAEKYYRDDLEVIGSGKPKLGIVERVLMKDGTRGWVQTDKIPYKNKKGEVLGLVVMAQDITERMRIAEELGESLDILRGTLESTMDGILVIDEKQRIVSYNRNFVRMWNIPEPVLATKQDSEAIRSVLDQVEDPDAFVKKIKELYEKNVDESMDVIRFKDGKVYERYSKSQKLGENRMGRVWSFRDVTERKKFEAELRKRAAALARSNTELEQFAYIASHDLQEPLRSVASFAELMMYKYADQLNTEAAKCIDHIMRGVTRMRGMINDLLNYSRLSEDAENFRKIDFEKVLEAVLSNLNTSIREKGAVLTHDPLPAVVGDLSQLTALLQNLIGNALKFYNKLPPHIHVSAKKNHDTWIFSVRDNGIGIEPEYQDRIFVIFQRLHKKEGYPGNGMGLAICKKVVERHGGKIWVESEPGKGTTFYFSIPVKQ